LTEKRIDTLAVDPRRVTLAGVVPTTRSVGGGDAGGRAAGGTEGVTTVGVPLTGSTAADGVDTGAAGGAAGDVSAGGAPTVIVWVAAVLQAETAATVGLPLWVSRK
jgi:hypothetical protein